MGQGFANAGGAAGDFEISAVWVAGRREGVLTEPDGCSRELVGLFGWGFHSFNDEFL